VPLLDENPPGGGPPWAELALVRRGYDARAMAETDPPIPVLEALIALAQLLANLVAARTKDVPSVLRRQRRALLIVAGLFAITAVYSTLLLV
jgi:hypothetical protein